MAPPDWPVRLDWPVRKSATYVLLHSLHITVHLNHIISILIVYFSCLMHYNFHLISDHSLASATFIKSTGSLTYLILSRVLY